MRIGHNVFVTLLDLLSVKHTRMHANRIFNEHPHKDNLFGLSEMLSGYGIQNAATRITDKETDIFNIELPFVAHLSDFVVVYKIDSDNAHCLLDGKKTRIPVSQFIRAWSGVILLAESSSESVEPNYGEHRKQEFTGIAQKGIYIFSSFNEDLVYANKYLIAVYLQKGRDTAMRILDEWFGQGKTLKERFFENLQLDMDNPAIEAEFNRHESWKEKTQLRATPAILVNGHKLPDNYKIEDLRYFTEFNFEIK